MQEVYDALFQDDLVNLGAATTAAKVNTIAQASYWTGMAQTYVLLGDPYTKLGIPTNYPYVTNTSPADGAINVVIDQAVQIQFSKPVDPDTVTLSGLSGVSLSPSWNEGFTAVEFSHDNLIHGQSYQVTVDADDNLGNALGDGIAPKTWTFVVVQKQLFLPVIMGD